jgi:hypothetical protein
MGKEIYVPLYNVVMHNHVRLPVSQNPCHANFSIYYGQIYAAYNFNGKPQCKFIFGEPKIKIH